MDALEQNKQKKAAAEAATQLVEDGMILGLGTGSTAVFFLTALSHCISAKDLHVAGIATSEQTAAMARSLRIPLTSFAEHDRVDLTVDGADEVEPSTLFLIKGRGGALLREKIVAAASKRMVVIADESKIVSKLGALVSVPVEVTQFGWQATIAKLKSLGADTLLRIGADEQPYVTDGGNHIIDCAFGPMEKPKEIAHHLDHVVGVVEHGLFLGLASQVFVGGHDGVKVLKL